TVGIPTFLLTLEPNYTPPAGRFMRNVMEIALPAAICNILLIMTISILRNHLNFTYETTSTLAVFAIGLIGYCALISTSNPLFIRKKVMIGISIALFIVTFIFSGNTFGLQSILDWQYTYIYVALLLI